LPLPEGLRLPEAFSGGWAASLLTLVAALLPLARALRRDRAAVMSGLPAGGSTSSERGLPSARSVALLSPAEVDALAIERQLVTCDCSRVTDGTDLTTFAEDFSTEEMLGIDTLGTLDSLAALPPPKRAAALPPEEDINGNVEDDGEAFDNADLHQLRLASCYLREFLARHHPLLGRAGPTCPFVPRALKIGSMRCAVVRSGPRPAAADMERIVREFIPIFESLEPRSGPTAVFKAPRCSRDCAESVPHCGGQGVPPPTFGTLRHARDGARESFP